MVDGDSFRDWSTAELEAEVRRLEALSPEPRGDLRLTHPILFADPACVEPVGLEPEHSCGGYVQSAFWLVDGQACAPETFDIRPRAAEVKQVYALEGASCVPATIPDGDAAVALGPPIPLETLAPVTPTVR